MCVHNYGYCYGNNVEGDYDDDHGGNNYSTSLYSTYTITIQHQFLSNCNSKSERVSVWETERERVAAAA